jgi:hypothetical protein
MPADGLITLHSGFGPEETMHRFEAEVRARGMTVFSHSTTPLALPRSACHCGRQIF